MKMDHVPPVASAMIPRVYKPPPVVRPVIREPFAIHEKSKKRSKTSSTRTPLAIVIVSHPLKRDFGVSIHTPTSCLACLEIIPAWEILDSVVRVLS